MNKNVYSDASRATASPELESQRWIERFVRALDAGDEWALEPVWEAAQNDPQLERLIGEAQLAWLQERELEPALNTAHSAALNAQADAEPNAALAFELARQNLSGASAAVSPHVRVDEVAGWLKSQGTSQNAAPAERAALGQLAGASVEIPALLSRANLQHLAHELRIVADKRFWKRFKDAAIALRMQRTTPQSQLALARHEKSNAKTNAIADANPMANPNADAVANADASSQADAAVQTDASSEANADAVANANADANANANADANANANADAKANADAFDVCETDANEAGANATNEGDVGGAMPGGAS